MVIVCYVASLRGCFIPHSSVFVFVFFADMLKDVGTTNSRDTLFVPHTPNALTDIQMQVKAGLDASTTSPGKTRDLLTGR